MGSKSDSVYVSLSKDAARLDYSGISGSSSCTIERYGGGTLRTYFDKEGAILHREPVDPKKGIEEIAMETARLLGTPVKGGEYSPVKLSKPCPTCAASTLIELLYNRVRYLCHPISTQDLPHSNMQLGKCGSSQHAFGFHIFKRNCSIA